MQGWVTALEKQLLASLPPDGPVRRRGPLLLRTLLVVAGLITAIFCTEVVLRGPLHPVTLLLAVLDVATAATIALLLRTGAVMLVATTWTMASYAFMLGLSASGYISPATVMLWGPWFAMSGMHICGPALGAGMAVVVYVGMVAGGLTDGTVEGIHVGLAMLSALLLSWRLDNEHTKARNLAARREQELADALDQIGSDLRAKSAFLATMSHEIRTPMNGVLGMTQLLQQTPLADDQRDMLDTIDHCGASLVAILDDILDISKLDAGQMAPEHIPFRPVVLVDEAIRLFSPRAREQGLRLTTRAELPPVPCMGDPRRIRQILHNLIGNAIKFTPSGGVRVTVKVSRGRLLFRVRDTGIGISPEKQSLIFDAFTQAEASTTRRFGGTGLGLHICRRFAEMMGGRLSVKSALGEGSTFTLSLPYESATEVPFDDTRTDPRVDTGLAPMRILVAEDNAINQAVVRNMLQKAGHSVEVVETGLAAVQRQRAGGVDLILMDIHMPEMDGLEATRHMRRDGATLPIVALTASAMAEDVAACQAAGMDLVLTKPLRMDDLYKALRKVTAEG